MKYKLLSIIMIIGVGMFSSCSNSDDSNGGKTVEASGEVRGGYRHLTINLASDSTKLVVYRGDYVKFTINDNHNPQSDYPLSIPQLGISSVLKDNVKEQPYFKMKTTGTFQLILGETVGEIDVVELRQSNYSELSAEDAWKLMFKNPPLLLDVRTKEEYNRGYIKDAVLIPLQELQERTGELEQYINQPILIYCATGNRSTTASKILLDMGFKNVMNLRMGIMGWASKGYNIQFR